MTLFGKGAALSSPPISKGHDRPCRAAEFSGFQPACMVEDLLAARGINVSRPTVGPSARWNTTLTLRTKAAVLAYEAIAVNFGIVTSIIDASIGARWI